MFRSLVWHVLALLVPLGVGALAFWSGRHIRRLPVWLRIVFIGFAFVIVVGGAAALAEVLPDAVNRLVSSVGGGTVLLSWVVLLLLGVAWSAPDRRFSSGFLACLVALAGCLLVIEGSGPFWWRFAAPDLFFNTPDSQGRLRQSSGLTCSPAAAAMLLHRYGIPASEGEMAYLAGTSLFGSDAPATARALDAKVRPRGWQVHAGHAGYDDCVRRGEPFLAHVRGPNLGHAVLVAAITVEHVRIIDPLDGTLKQMSPVDFERAWDGTAVWVDRQTQR